VNDVLDTPDAKAQLLLAKDLTRRTGILVEAQITQLRIWPMVSFDDVSDVEINPLDVETKTIHYLWRVRKVPSGADLMRRAEQLGGWVRSLLGDDWKINIKIKQKKGGPGRLIWNGQRKVALSNEEGEGRVEGKYGAAMVGYKRYRLREKDAIDAVEEDKVDWL